MLITPARPRRNLRLKVLVFGVVVGGGTIMLGAGWDVGRQAGAHVSRLPVSNQLRVSVKTP